MPDSVTGGSLAYLNLNRLAARFTDPIKLAFSDQIPLAIFAKRGKHEEFRRVAP